MRRGGARLRGRVLTGLLLGLAVAPAAAAAQFPPTKEPPPEPSWTTPRWFGDAAFIGINAVVGGVTAGVIRELRGGSFGDAFLTGAVGGVAAYGGRRIAGQRFDGAGLLGRQVSAVGISVLRNAGDGVPALQRLFFPLGPVDVYVDRASGLHPSAKLNVYRLVALTSVAAQRETRFDLAATLSAGAPVFTAPGLLMRTSDGATDGVTYAGSIVVSTFASTGYRLRGDARVFAHERVHVLQGDFIFRAWSDPAERWALGRSGFTRTLYRFIDPGFAAPLVLSGLGDIVTVGWYDRPREIEADFVSR